MIIFTETIQKRLQGAYKKSVLYLWVVRYLNCHVVTDTS